MHTMKVIDISYIDFINYKKASMVISMPKCDFKCNRECNGDIVCQNYSLRDSKIIDIDIDKLVSKYINDPYTSAIIFSGFEPFYRIPYNNDIDKNYLIDTRLREIEWLDKRQSSFNDIFNFLYMLRIIYKCNDDVVIYSGYTQEELSNPEYNIIEILKKYYTSEKNKIIIKCGRFIPNNDPHLDPILGIKLASDNQYAIEL